MKPIKIIAVGDPTIGKTALFRVYEHGTMPLEPIPPTAYDSRIVWVSLNNEPCQVCLCDVSGQGSYDQLRTLSYPQVDVSLICFSLDNPDTLDNVFVKWLPEVRRNLPGRPYVLVGLKSDRRSDEKVIRDLKLSNQWPVTTEEGVSAASAISAFAYEECSATSVIGINEVFTKAINSAMQLSPAYKKGSIKRLSRRIKGDRAIILRIVHPWDLRPDTSPTQSPTVDSTSSSIEALTSNLKRSLSSFLRRPPNIAESNIVESSMEHLIDPFMLPERPKSVEHSEEIRDIPIAVDDVVDYSSATYDWIGLHQRLSAESRVPRDGSEGMLDWGKTVVKSSEYCIGSGRFGDVYRGKVVNLPKGDKIVPPPDVAIKVIKLLSNEHLESSKRAAKQLKREMEVWQSLEHPNVVKFIGVTNAFGSTPALISIWMENGNLRDYLEANPDVDRVEITLGVARGLQYLHNRKPEIVHGDVKAVNILVNSKGEPGLADFGLSRMLDDTSLWVTSATSAPGSLRWMAPELLKGQQTTVTTASDIYAYAMTCLEILTGQVPFAKYRRDEQVITALLLRDERPERPSTVSDQMWSLLERAWKTELSERLDIRQIGTQLYYISAKEKKKAVFFV